MPKLRSSIVAALLLAVPVHTIAAQVQPLPPARQAATTWVSGSGALIDVQSFFGGADGEAWNWGSGVQLRGTIERALRRAVQHGLDEGLLRPEGVSDHAVGDARALGHPSQAQRGCPRIGDDRERGVEQALSTLPPRDAKVLRLYFGLEGGREHTLEEIGSMLGVTRERVRQLRDRALKRLREGDVGRALGSFAA